MNQELILMHPLLIFRLPEETVQISQEAVFPRSEV